jgi:dimethyl sulfoxide reductase iron-sulfur subunit
MTDTQAGQLSRRAFLGGAVAGVAVGAVSGVAAPPARADDDPGPEAPRIRQWAMIIDLRRCDGCVGRGLPPQCTQACIWSRYVPEDQQWLEVFERPASDLPGAPRQFVPLPCVQCQNAPCVNVCPVGATYHNAEGVVLIDQDRCIGCRQCMAACPYGARSFNWDDPPNPPEADPDDYRPEFPLPHRRGVTAKCMLCAHHLEDGRLPACADGCPMFAIYLADLNTDLATNGQEVVQFSRFLAEHNAYQLKEYLGTRPRVWYIPGHGQEYDRRPDDERQPERARTWLEMREDGELPRGVDALHEPAGRGQS